MNLVIRGENLENLMLLPFFSTCNQPLTGTGFHHSLMEFFQFTDLAFIWHLENLSLFLIWSKTLVCFLKVLWLLKMAAKFFTISFTVQVWMLLLIEHILVLLLGPPKVIICVVGLWCRKSENGYVHISSICYAQSCFFIKRNGNQMLKGLRQFFVDLI